MKIIRFFDVNSIELADSARELAAPARLNHLPTRAPTGRN